MTRPHIFRSRAAAIYLLVGAVAFLARLVPVLRGGGLQSRLFYDDGVYYTAAAALADGRMPYRDFLLVHPPGIAIFVAPFAFLGRVIDDPTGLATARLAFMVLGAITAVLVTVIVGRLSWQAALVAGLFYAVWTPAAHSETSTLLEPLVNVCVAGALVAIADPRTASRTRVVGAGVLLGAACAVKLWAVIPLLVLAVWLWRQSGLKAMRRLVVGAGAVFLVICLPFFAMAPTAMPRMVFFDQASRSVRSVSLVRRFGEILSLSISSSRPGIVTALAVASFLALLVAMAVLAAVRVPESRPWVSLLAANLLTLLVVSTFFPKYADFVALPLALVVGAYAHLCVIWARSRERSLSVPIIGSLALAFTVLAVSGGLSPVGAPGVRTDLVAATTARARCVATDNPILLIQANLLTRDLRNGCEVAADPTGVSYDLTQARLGTAAGGRTRATDGPWQRWIADYLQDSNAFVLDSRPAMGLAQATIRCLVSRSATGIEPHVAVVVLPTGSAPEDRSTEEPERMPLPLDCLPS